MSSPREELLRLVEELPEDSVPAALADVRRRLKPVRERAWPPGFFGAAAAGRSDTAARADELLDEGFGQSS